MDLEWSSFYKWSLKVHVHCDLLFASSVKTAGYEHSMQSPSHTSALQIHSGLHPFIFVCTTPPLFYSVQIWLLWSSIGTRPFEDVKASGKNEGEKYLLYTHTGLHTHTCIHKFRVEYMHSTWLICLWKWLLFFICFYEFQKNKNKKRVKWKVKDDT